MEFDKTVFGNADILTATGLSSATVQTWANRGIFALSENQRNPGAGQKRVYSGFDIVRIAATKALIDRGLSTNAAGAITLRLERSPQTSAAWRKALEENAPHIHVFVDGPEVVRIYVGNDPGEVAQILTELTEPAEGGFLGAPSERQHIKAAVFDIGPEVSHTVRMLQLCKNARSYSLMFTPATDGQATVTLSAIPAPSFTEGKRRTKEFATTDDLLHALAMAALPSVTARQLTAIGIDLASGKPVELGGRSGVGTFYVSEETLIALGVLVE